MPFERHRRQKQARYLHKRPYAEMLEKIGLEGIERKVQ